MPKVTHNIKSNLELRRGSEDSSSDPYLYQKKLPWRIKQQLQKTLELFNFSSWRSRTSNNDNFIKQSKYTRTIGLSSSIVLLLILSLTFIPAVGSKQEKADAASGAASSTEINITDGKATVNLTATSEEGTFATSSSTEMAEFGVKTTNYTGYTLTIVADDDDKTLVNSDSSITTHNTFSSITTVIDEKTFDTSTYNGMWGYKPSKMNSTDNVGFWPSPTTKATTLNVTSCANSTTSCPDSEDTYTIALGARAGYAQAAGTYSKTMTLTATPNPVNYSVTYTDNTGIAATNLPDTTNNSTSATEITLSTVTPSKTGFKFNGWCDTVPTVAADKTATCPGSTYAVGTSYPINQTTTNNITLYATWTIPTYDITIKPTTGIKNVAMVNSTGTVDTCTSTTGCTISGLTYGKSYDITATTEDGYTFSAWSPEGAGSIANITNPSTSFTVGDGITTITAVAAGAAAKSVTVNFAYAGGGTTGVSSVTFKETATGTTAGTISTSGGSVLLNPGIGYTVTTTTSSSSEGTYGIKSYALNNASYGSLSFTGNVGSSDTTNYFTPNSSSSDAVITIGTCLKTFGSATTNMQGFSANLDYMCDDATGQLKDSRDNQVYTVGVVTYRGSGITSRALWMTRNLAIGCNGSGTAYGSDRKTGGVNLTSANSNVSATWNTSSAGALTEGDSYDVARMQCDSTYGAWYNYAAATVGTITGESNSTTPTEDICPSGWSLPSHTSVTRLSGDIDAFRPVAGGNYIGGRVAQTTYGCWWVKEKLGLLATDRWRFTYEVNIKYSYLDIASRSRGFYVRCVRNS